MIQSLLEVVSTLSPVRINWRQSRILMSVAVVIVAKVEHVQPGGLYRSYVEGG